MYTLFIPKNINKLSYAISSISKAISLTHTFHYILAQTRQSCALNNAVLLVIRLLYNIRHEKRFSLFLYSSKILGLYSFISFLQFSKQTLVSPYDGRIPSCVASFLTSTIVFL